MFTYSIIIILFTSHPYFNFFRLVRFKFTLCSAPPFLTRMTTQRMPINSFPVALSRSVHCVSILMQTLNFSPKILLVRFVLLQIIIDTTTITSSSTLCMLACPNARLPNCFTCVGRPPDLAMKLDLNNHRYGVERHEIKS